jgi:hypothetical protein
MKTIYVINGGGQRIRQNTRMNMPTEYIVSDDKSWAESSGVSGVDSYTGAMWNTDFETLQRWANDWAEKEVELIEA